MSDEDYAAFVAAGGDGAAAEALLKKYLSKVRDYTAQQNRRVPKSIRPQALLKKKPSYKEK